MNSEIVVTLFTLFTALFVSVPKPSAPLYVFAFFVVSFFFFFSILRKRLTNRELFLTLLLSPHNQSNVYMNKDETNAHNKCETECLSLPFKKTHTVFFCGNELEFVLLSLFHSLSLITFWIWIIWWTHETVHRSTVECIAICSLFSIQTGSFLAT